MYDISKIIKGLNPRDAMKIIELSEMHDYDLLYYYIDSIIKAEESAFTKTKISNLSSEIYLFRDYLECLTTEDKDNVQLEYLSLDEYCEDPDVFR
jgi:hypothetical protein